MPSDAVLEGLDAARRAGWAKFYEADRLRRDYKELVDELNEECEKWFQIAGHLTVALVVVSLGGHLSTNAASSLLDFAGAETVAAMLQRKAERLAATDPDNADFLRLLTADWIASRQGEQPPPPHHPA